MGELMMEHPREDVVVVKGDEGAVSLELMPLHDKVARAFLRQSPRNPRFSRETAARISEELAARPYDRILLQDTKRGLMRRTASSVGWNVRAAVDSSFGSGCSLVTTYDLPIDERLTDHSGRTPDISGTVELSGISADLPGGGRAWAFYTDDGETARILDEDGRRQGFFVAYRDEDLPAAAECLVRFLAASKKSWAVFSMDMGRFVRKYDPMTMIRMSLDDPKAFDHAALPVSVDNKSELLRLFSEYYDEPLLQSRFRLRRFRSDKHYSIHMVEGGFVINRFEGNLGLIYDIYVTPASQGHGLGTQLMRCALSEFAGRVPTCYLHTSYPRAKRLYEKFGFRAVHAQLGIRLDEIALEPPRRASVR